MSTWFRRLALLTSLVGIFFFNVVFHDIPNATKVEILLSTMQLKS